MYIGQPRSLGLGEKVLNPVQWEPRREERQREKTKIEVLTQTKSISETTERRETNVGHPMGEQSKAQESERIWLGANRKPQPC